MAYLGAGAMLTSVCRCQKKYFNQGEQPGSRLAVHDARRYGRGCPTDVRYLRVQIMKTTSANAESRIFGGCVLLFVGLLMLVSGRFSLSLRLFTAVQGVPMVLGAVAAYCGAAALVTSIVDRVDGTDGAYRYLGRWFWWVGLSLAFLAGALVLTSVFLPALAGLVRWGVALLAVVCGLLLAMFLEQPKRSPPPAKTRDRAAASSFLKTGLALLLMGVASILMVQRYNEYQDREQGYEAREQAERSAAQPWMHEFDSLPGGLSVEQLKTRVAAGGHRLTCFSRAELEPQNRLEKDDTHDCWVNVGQAWGIPAHMVVFGFGEHGLRSQMLRFPDTAWSRVEEHLDAIGKRQAEDFGMDSSSRLPITGWRIESGLMFSAAPLPGEEVTVLWSAKDELARQYCPYESNPTEARQEFGYHVPVSTFWPEIDCRQLH